MVIPKFKSNYLIEKIGAEGVVLLSENNYQYLSGEPLMSIVALINGKNSVDDIITRLEGKISMPEIFYVLEVLKNKGHIVEAIGGVDTATEAFWHGQYVTDSQALSEISKKRVAVKIINNFMPFAEVLSEFKRAGIQVVSENPELEIVLTDDYDQEEIAIINKRNLSSALPWLLIKPVGIIPWIGPFFNLKTESACWECMMQRIRSNRQMEAYIKSIKGQTTPLLTSIASYPPSVSIALNIGIIEAARYLVMNTNTRLHNTLLSFSANSFEITKHHVAKRPQCKICGSEDYLKIEYSPKIVQLSPSPKKFKNDGGHRTMFPEETYERLKKHVSAITGIVSHLERIDEYDQFNLNGAASLIFTFAAGHNFAMLKRRGISLLLKNLRGRSGGKGASEIQAKVSGMCEAIERYSGVYRGNEPFIKGSYNELKEMAIHPSTYLHFSESQYHNRIAWNESQQSDYHLVPEEFNDDRKIEWAPYTCLNDNQIRYFPSAYSYYGHPDIIERFDTACDANGNAAGNTVEEAILQGFLELVERDAVAIWWYTMSKVREIDVESFNDKYLNDLKILYKKMNREFWVLDITTDLGIHTFAAVSRRTDKPAQDITLGFGAHLDPKIAILRAVTEVNQFMPCIRENPETGVTEYSFSDEEAIIWWKSATIENQPYLVPDQTKPKLKFEDFEDLSANDVYFDVRKCIDMAAKVGLKTYVLNQTRPDIELCVFKVLVPGLRHFWKRLAPGRLFDVPVKLGRLKEPLTEETLNPYGIFF